MPFFSSLPKIFRRENTCFANAPTVAVIPIENMLCVFASIFPVHFPGKSKRSFPVGSGKAEEQENSPSQKSFILFFTKYSLQNLIKPFNNHDKESFRNACYEAYNKWLVFRTFSVDISKLKKLKTTFYVINLYICT